MPEELEDAFEAGGGADAGDEEDDDDDEADDRVSGGGALDNGASASVIDDSRSASSKIESSISIFVKSRTSSSTFMSRPDMGSSLGSSIGTDDSFHVATVWPFARRIGRFNSACAGRGGTGVIALLRVSKTW